MSMEVRDYLQVYWSQRKLITGLTLAVVTVALIWAGLQPTQYGVSVSFAISRINKEATGQYEYDGYYALQAADTFSQTVVSWFRTPSILKEFYQQAAVDPEIDSINGLAGRFAVKKYSAQNIVVRFNERTIDRANKLAVALPVVLAEKTGQLNQTADGKSIFAVTGSTPVAAPVKISWWLVGGLSLFAGLTFSIFLAAARHWLRG